MTPSMKFLERPRLGTASGNQLTTSVDSDVFRVLSDQRLE
jgi:hypothetical protein